MTLKRFLSASVSLLLCAIMLLGVIPVLPATAAGAEKVEIAADRYHYGVVGAENNIELDAKTLYEMIFGEELDALSETERAYLDEYSFTLTYNNAIPTDVIRTHYDRESGVLDVTVSAYSYVAENARLVSWIPNVVTIGEGERQKLATLEWDNQKSAYVCRFTGMEYMEQDFDMNVSFSWSVEIDNRAIRALLLNSQIDGAEAERILEEYEMACEEYRAKVALREKWDKYYADYAAYQNYLSQKELFDAWITYESDKEKFDDYVRKKAENDAAWEAYNQYALLKAEYDLKKGEFAAYEKKINDMRAHVAILDMMFIEDSNGWSLYGGVCGSTVDLVISKLDTAENYFGSAVRPMVIKLKDWAKPAKDATNVLEPLLKEYRDIKNAKYASDDARLIACYQFYSKNYETLRANFKKLQESLFTLYSDSLVVSLMEEGGQVVDGVKYDGKGPHFRQFLGQLYIMQCCLDDTIALNKTQWRPTNADPNFQKLRLSDVVEACQHMEDTNNAKPITGYPTASMARPIEPTPVNQPSAPPVEVFEPERPAGKKPDSLTVVTPPVRPVEADPGDPGAAPEAPVMSDLLRAWATEYKNVDYRARENAVSAKTLSFDSEIVYSVSIDNKFRIKFLMPDGTQFGETQLFQGGMSLDSIQYPEAPVKDQTAEWSYEFDRWERLTDGNAYIIDSDITFRAVYRWTKRTYPVEWKVDGEVVLTELYEYGEIPSYMPAQKPTTEMYTYTFSGWNTYLLPVTEAAIYEGSFIATLRQYEITWILDGGARVETYQLDASESVPTYTGVKDYVKDSELYFFRSWTPTCSSILGNASYTAIYEPGVSVNGVDLSVEDGAVVATLHEGITSVLLDKLYDFVERTEYDLVLRCDNAGVSLSPAAVALLKESGCLRLGLEEISTDRAGSAYELCFYGANKKKLQIDTEVTVLYYYAAATGVVPTCYWMSNGEWVAVETTRAGGVMRGGVRGAGEFVLATEYRVSYVPSTYCNTSSLIAQAPAGTLIDVSRASYLYGYEAVGVTLTLSDGSTRIIRGKVFEMPASVTSVKIDVQKIVYTVSYVVDGKVVEVQEYYLGDVIVPPTAPTLERNDGNVYSFTGWTPVLTVATGSNRDLVCVAEFSASHMTTEDDLKALENQALTNMVTTAIFIAIGVVVVIVGAIVAIVVAKRRRNNR